jgi:23S rRNA pseudouridine2605 synthase
LVLAYHKPKGLLTTHRDELGRETVYDRLQVRLPPPLARVDWHAIGRLDADTTGLLLFTNDGALVHFATQPTSKVKKTYRVLAKGLLDEATLDRLREGVELTGGLGRSGPCEATLVGHQIATSWLDLTLAEGKNRQVRRMLLAVGSQVIRLERTRIGDLDLRAIVPEVDTYVPLIDGQVEAGLGYTPRALASERRR